jgi:hypothetical protein
MNAKEEKEIISQGTARIVQLLNTVVIATDLKTNKYTWFPKTDFSTNISLDTKFEYTNYRLDGVRYGEVKVLHDDMS